MKHPASQALHAYWSSLCDGRRAPERGDLDPAAMRQVLAQTFLLDVDVAQPDMRRLPIRLSGTRLDALFARDLKGAAFVDLWSDADQVLLRAIARDVLDESLPAIIGGHASPGGPGHLGFELLLLPLRHLGRTHVRMLGGLAFADTPTWLGLQAVHALEITSWRMLDDVPPGRVAETGFPKCRERGARHAHLIVYEGGRTDTPVPFVGRQARVKPSVSRWVSRP